MLGLGIDSPRGRMYTALRFGRVVVGPKSPAPEGLFGRGFYSPHSGQPQYPSHSLRRRDADAPILFGRLFYACPQMPPAGRERSGESMSTVVEPNASQGS